MKEQTHIRCRQRSAHTGEEGIALILTLGILAVILIIAVGFALSARTELKSSSSYGDMIAAESLAKMGMDRCIMEIAYQGLRQPFSGDTNNYLAVDLTGIDGSSNNDLFGTAFIDGTAKGDFVNLDAAPQRSSNEPYWIVVSNRTGQIIGRFAYIASGSTADINAIGNISGLGDIYKRGNGSIGIATNWPADPACGGTNTYTRGICSDVNLAAFLRQLGYSSWDESARRILCYRYGWPAGGGAPLADIWKPGDATFDDNGDGVLDSPQEYDPVQPKGCAALGQVDQAIPDLGSLDNGLTIAPDAANTNLPDYATTTSSDPNLTNGYGIARLNLNEMTGASNVGAVVNMLSQVPLGNSSVTKNPNQIALNIIDFHTPGLYPTVYQPPNSTNTLVGIKATPYLNQILNVGTISLVPGITNASGDVAAKIRVEAFTAVEVWNPYSGPFPDPCHEPVTYSLSLSAFTLDPATNLVGSSTFTIPSPVASGITFIKSSSLVSYEGTQFATNSFPFPLKLTVTNLVTWSDFYGLNPENKINIVAGQAFTNATLSFVSIGQSFPLVINMEADDPRMGILYNQPNDFPPASQTYSLGTNNINTISPTSFNFFTGYADSGPREGEASFYIKTNDYVTIGEIGYVYRGEPWATIRLQPNQDHPTTEPLGEGNILEYIRVNDLSEIRGRIGINADTNGPFGASQSPLLFALLEGLSNSAGSFITGAKIQQIIFDMGDRRARNGDFTGIGQICGITALTTAFGAVLPTSDYERETIIRNISNLITARPDSGVTDVVAWGQVIKGKAPPAGKYFAGPIVQIRAKYSIDRAGHLVRITKFQYTRQ